MNDRSSRLQNIELRNQAVSPDRTRPAKQPTWGDGLGPYPGSVQPSADFLIDVPWSGDGHGSRRAQAPLPSVQPSPFEGYPSPAAYAGDGTATYAPHGTPASADARVPYATAAPALTTMKTPKAELWKLLMLVVFFVIWISTASTLLFLYMDRYLFPG